MDPLSLLAGLALGAAGGLALWASASRRAAAAEALLDAERRHADVRLATERARAAEQLALVEDARGRLTDAFKALSADALRESTSSFLALARETLDRQQEGARGALVERERAVAELVAPVKERLAKLDEELRTMERTRASAHGALVEGLRSLAEAQGLVRAEAASLVRALRASHVRGRWGELQLRRVVELAGMISHCDFHEQESAEGDAGRLRPDLVVHLPGGRNVVVDAKAPLAAYLDATEATDDAVRAARYADHARQLREHVAALSRKAYWEVFQPAPEFVVLFLPGESFYAAALEADPSLLEAGVERRVLVATPTTLIALLKAVAYGWQKEAAQENADAVAAVGRDLYKRLGDLGEHLSRLGRSLAQSVEAYNRAVGSAEARLVPAARRLAALGAAGEGAEAPAVSPIEALPRPVLAPELLAERRGGVDFAPPRDSP
jgi:DNA recombination protein RmuC